MARPRTCCFSTSPRPQLRAAGASLRPVRRLHDRVPPGAAGGCPGNAAGASDDSAERPSHLREGAHSRHVDVRRGDRHPPPTRRLGARRRRSCQRAAPGGEAGATRSRRTGGPRRPARLLEGEGAFRGPAPDPDLGRRAAGEGGRRVLRRDGHPDPRGVRPHGVHDRGCNEHEASAVASALWGRPCPASSCVSPTTASS